MTQTISTIVDRNGGIVPHAGLYDPNNFYYCRFLEGHAAHDRLYDPNNFYYCRLI